VGPQPTHTWATPTRVLLPHRLQSRVLQPALANHGSRSLVLLTLWRMQIGEVGQTAREVVCPRAREVWGGVQVCMYGYAVQYKTRLSGGLDRSKVYSLSPLRGPDFDVEVEK
jgi:hypothetical protein